MNTVIMENHEFIYLNEKRRDVILNCKDFLSNKSRIPMHSAEGALTIPDLVMGLIKEYSILARETDEEIYSFENALLDILVSSFLARTPYPVRALELGAVSGIVSCHLAALLGRFNPASSLCCVGDTIYTGSENEWLKRIAGVKQPPRLSFLAADYEDTQLQEAGFSLVVMNGTAEFPKAGEAILEARRLLKEDGLFICYSVGNSPLGSCFKRLFHDITEYPLPNGTVMTAKDLVENPIAGERAAALRRLEEVRDFIKEQIQLMEEEKEIDIRLALEKIRGCLTVAVAEKKTDIKNQLIELKEELLNYALSSL